MFLTGSIERYGTGFPEMYALIAERGLKEPDFEDNKTFLVTLWRPSATEFQVTAHDAAHDTAHDTGHDTVHDIAHQMHNLIHRISSIVYHLQKWGFCFIFSSQHPHQAKQSPTKPQPKTIIYNQSNCTLHFKYHFKKFHRLFKVTKSVYE